MFCEHCGKQFKDGEDFCPYCGTLAEDAQTSQQSAAQHGQQNQYTNPQTGQTEIAAGFKGWLWFLFIISGIVCILNVAAIMDTLSDPWQSFEITSAGWVLVIFHFVNPVGVGCMLFAHKKAGFYIYVIAAVICLIVNLSIKNMIGLLGVIGIVITCIGAVPAMKKNALL